jgi:tetratricopeptide (TPR) repeat protein
MSEYAPSSIPSDDPFDRDVLPVEPSAIQSTRPKPRLAAVKEKMLQAEAKQVADPSRVVAGRKARWRPVALTAAVLVVLGASLTGGALWWRHREAALREEVTSTLAEAIRLRDAGQFPESRELLENALARLGASGPSDLVNQASMVLVDTRLVERLDTPRQRLFDNLDAGSPLDFAETEREYATTLNDAVLVREGEEKDVIAARVRNSSVRAAVLAAIQDWAAVTADEPRRVWLLAVASAADPDPDRDRLRRPELWWDWAGLVRLPGEPVPKSLSPELAVALERRAMSANVPGPVPLLIEVQKRHPQDYWLNFATGFDLHHHQKWDEAIRYHRAALATRPRAAAVYYNLGMTLRGQRKWDESLEQFEQALRLDPKFANAHNGIGLVLHAKGKPDEAMEHYKEALRINPKHATAQVNLGIILAEKKRINEAISKYEAALSINPRHARAHFHYGNALRARNDLDRAIGQYQDAVTINPRYAAAHNALGHAFHAKKELDQAIHHFEKATQNDKANATLRANLGDCLRLKGRLDEAITQFQEALRIDPNNAFAENGLGNTLRDKGDLDGAIPHYEKATQFNPKNATYHVNFGTSLRLKGRLDEAITQFQTALEIDPNIAFAENGLGIALNRKGDLDGAIPHYETASRLDPKNATYRANLGSCLHLKGRLDEAITRFQEALHIDQKNAFALNGLGIALTDKGDLDGAISHYEKAIGLDPKNATLRANLGNCLRLKGRLDEAITQFQEALRIDQKNAFALNGLGIALTDKGDLDGAISHYEKAIGLDPKEEATYRANLGNTLLALGRHDAAISQYKQAHQINPKISIAESGLGSGFLSMGKLDQAIRCFERAIKLNDKNSHANSSLGIAQLYGQGRTAEAIAHFKRAAEIQPKSEVIQFNVGQGLLASGQFSEAREAVRRSLGLSAPGQPYDELVLQTMRQLEDGDRLSAMEARLPAIIQKKEKPVDTAEALKFAWLCQVKLHFAAAARLYADGFAADPKSANELSAGYRFHAARCAALAAAGWGQDSPKPSDAERTRLRGQTLEWLRADLTAWQKQIALANQAARSAARRTITLWLTDFRFFAVREKEELAKLPDEERAAWEKLWADTEALRIEARADRAAERWADTGLRVVEGLELWLDAARLNAARQAGGQAPLKAGDEVETWFDNSGKGRHVGQSVPAARPRLVRVGQDWLVRFDGADDHLRCTGLGRSLAACTVFLVAAPHTNPGGFRAFLAANEAGKNDAQTGFNIDMGPDATEQFDQLNVEGAGFSGIQNLLDRRGFFGNLHVLELVADPGRRTVRLILDGRPSRERSLAPAPISQDEVTVGARYTTLRGEPLHACGCLPGDIAEVLVYNRALSADETKAVRQYLDRKYTRLRQALPAALSVK